MIQRIKILIILLLLFISTDLFSGKNEWKMLPVPEFFHNIPGTKEFYDISCYDSLNCMAYLQYQGPCGNLIIRTTDGGMSWTNVYFDTCHFGNQSIPFPCQIKSIAYPGPNLFIAVGDSGFVLRTSDKGGSWSTKRYYDKDRFFNVRMYDDKYGLVLNYIQSQDEVDFLKTNDGGFTFKKMNNPLNFFQIYSESYQMIDSNLFYMLYWEPFDKSMRLLRVHGDWESWDTTFLCYNYRLHYMSFLNEKVGYIGGELPIGATTYKKWIIKTEDGGYNWKTVLDSNMYASPLFDLKFYDENYGFAASGWWTMVSTSNGGSSWEADRLTEDTAQLHNFYIFTSLQVPCQTTAYCIGDGYYLWKFTRDWTSVEDKEPLKLGIAEMSITGNADKIKIDYTLPTPGQVKIKIFNSLGALEGVIFEGFSQSSDSGSTQFDASALPSGMYFITLESSGIRLCRQYALIK